MFSSVLNRDRFVPAPSASAALFYYDCVFPLFFIIGFVCACLLAASGFVLVSKYFCPVLAITQGEGCGEGGGGMFPFSLFSRAYVSQRPY